MGFRDRIQKFFKRDTSSQIAQKGRGFTFDDPMGGGGEIVTSSSSRNLTNALSMDQALLQRYADYENMDDYPELQAALDIYADDTTITDSVRGKTIWGMSRDKVIRDIIDDLLHRRIRIEENIWMGIRTLCKYGNAFAEVVTTDVGVVGLDFLPVPTMRRLVTSKGDLLGFVQDLSGRFQMEEADYKDLETVKKRFFERGMIFFEPWEIIHWRLRSKFINSLYGYSVLDAARWIWKRLAMLEDTALVYKLTRSPSRYAFYVDTGELPPDEAMALVRRNKQSYKKKSLTNPATGQLEFRNNPLSPEDDMWMATRGGKDSTRVEVLSGPSWQSMEDIEYFRDKMFTSIKIPKSYYGGEAEADGALAQKDVRFARTCLRIQREWRNGIRQLVRVHFAVLGIDPDTVEWETRMTPPSSIFELQQIEVMNAQAGLMETLSQWFDDTWLIQRVLGFSEDDAVKIAEANRAEREAKMNDLARIEQTLKNKYPDSSGGIGPDEAPVQENVDVRIKLVKLMESIKETSQRSNRVLKRVESIEPALERAVRKMSK